MEDLVVNERFRIPAAEMSERFETSGGPGGQHANRSATRVILSYDLANSSALDETMKRRVVHRLGSRIDGGVITVVSDETRSQWRNRSVARKRLTELLSEALRPPPPRRPTKPSRSQRRQRLADKRARGDIKRMRRRPIDGD